MAKAKLTYAPTKGLAETSRMIMCLGGIEFEKITLESREQMIQLEKGGKLLFGQLPLLEIDGLNLVQSRATCRYLARKCGMFGKTEAETVRIDMMFEGTKDFFQIWMGAGYMKPMSECIKEYNERQKEKYMAKFDKFIAENSTGFLVGDSVSLADVGLMETLLEIEKPLGRQFLDEFPNVKELYGKMRNLLEEKSYFSKYRGLERLPTEEMKRILGYLGMSFPDDFFVYKE